MPPHDPGHILYSVDKDEIAYLYHQFATGQEPGELEDSKFHSSLSPAQRAEIYAAVRNALPFTTIDEAVKECCYAIFQKHAPSKEYVVRWEIELDAISPVEAAKGAREMQRDLMSRVGAFQVRENEDRTAEWETVDLDA